MYHYSTQNILRRIFHFLLIRCLLYFLLFSCKNSTGPPPDNSSDTTSHEFTWEYDTLAYPRSDQTLIESLWGSSENDVYAVGHNDRGLGTIWHWDGNSWKSLVNYDGPIDPYYLRGGSYNQVFGTSKDDVWIVGGNVRGDYPNFIRQELLLHYNGSEWIKKEFDGRWIVSVWGISADDVWFGSGDSELIHFNGTNWTTYELGIKVQVHSISGLSSDEVYAIASGWGNQAPDDSSFNYFLKYDENEWKIIDEYLYTGDKTTIKFGSNLWNDLNTQHIYSSGNGIYLWNNKEWIYISNIPKGGINGSSENNIFTFNWWGSIYHYNGENWKKLNQLPKLDFSSVWCNNKYVFISAHIFDGVQKSVIIRGKQKDK